MASNGKDDNEKGKGHSILDAVEVRPGLHRIFAPAQDAQADIVLVPGLGAHPYHTWIWKGPNAPQGFSWIREALPADFPTARILLFQYKSQWFGNDSVSASLTDIANSLVRDLDNDTERKKAPQRPILFIGHSLGGLVIAKAIWTAQARNDYFPRVFRSITGCLFLGSPFRGSEASVNAGNLADVLGAFGLSSKIKNSALLQLLKPQDDTLQEVVNNFTRIANRNWINIFCFYETLDTQIGFRFVSQNIKLVSQSSAVLDGAEALSMNCNHKELNKYRSADDDRYLRVRSELNRMIEDGGPSKRRQNAERQPVFDSSRLSDYLARFPVDKKGADTDLEDIRNSSGSDTSYEILNQSSYLEWRDSNRPSLLWISGEQGRGKTAAAASIITDLQVSVPNTDPTGNRANLKAFFFCGPGRRRDKGLNVLYSITDQLITEKRSLGQYLLDAADDSTGSGTKNQHTDGRSDSRQLGGASFPIRAMWRCLQNMLGDQGIQAAYVVVSNLHGIEAGSLQELLDAWTQERKDKSMLKLLVISQNKDSIRVALQTAIRIDLDAHESSSLVNNGLRLYAVEKANELANNQQYPQWLRNIVTAWMRDTAGDRVWVDLVFLHLNNDSIDHHNVPGIMQMLPPDQEALTQYICAVALNSALPDTGLIREIFRAVALAYSYPSVPELAVLVDYPLEQFNEEEFTQRYINQCGSLLELFRDDEDGEDAGFATQRVRFKHRGIEDFLCDSYDFLSLDEDGKKRQHGIFAQRCFDYIVRATETSPENGNTQNYMAPHTIDRQVPFSVTRDDGAQTYSSGNYNAAMDGNRNHARDYVVPIWQGQAQRLHQDSGYGYSHDSYNHYDMRNRHQGVTGADVGYQSWQTQSSSTDQYYAGMPTSYEHITAPGWRQYNIPAQDSSANSQQPYRQVPAPSFGNTVENADSEPESDSEEADDSDEEIDYPWIWWIEHAKDATPDVVHKLGVDDRSLEHPFWKACSNSRARWLERYRETDDFLENLENWTPLHIGAFFGFAPLVDALLRTGHASEVHERDSFHFQPLWWACEQNHLEIVEKLLQSGASVDDQHCELDSTPLQTAAAGGFEAIITTLLSHHAHLDVINKRQGTALYRAVENGYTEIASLLLRRGANPNIEGGIHRTVLNVAAYHGEEAVLKLLLDNPYHRVYVDSYPRGYEYGNAVGAAAQQGHTSIMDTLISRGCSFNSASKISRYPLAVAALSGHVETAELLLERGSNVESQQQALRQAAKSGSVEIVNMLLDRSPYLDRNKALVAASSYGNDDVVKRLYDWQCIVPEALNDALYEAADHEQESTVAVLLDLGANPNYAARKEYGTALIASAYDGTIDIAKALLDAGADPNYSAGDYGYALQAAAFKGRQAMVLLLLERRANINTPSEKYGTPLHAAASSGLDRPLGILLEHGADPNQQGGPHGFPLIAAAEAESKFCLRALLEWSANPANPNVKGGKKDTTALVIAAEKLPAESVEALLYKGADPNAADRDGNTALIMAATVGDAEVLRMLLDWPPENAIHWGVPVRNLVSKENGTALHAAAAGGYTDCCRILLEYGMEPWQRGGKYGTVLQAAASSGDVECLKLFLSDHMPPTDVNAREESSLFHTALQAAAAAGSGGEACVAELLRHGADPNLVGGKHGTALEAACYSPGNALGLLLENGADPNLTDGKHDPVLHTAALKKPVEFVQHLLDRGAIVNATGTKFGSALNAAAYIQDMEVIELLLRKYDADPHRVGKVGNALENAMCRGASQVFDFLLEECEWSSQELTDTLLEATVQRELRAVQKVLERCKDHLPHAVLDSAMQSLHMHKAITLDDFERSLGIEDGDAGQEDEAAADDDDTDSLASVSSFELARDDEEGQMETLLRAAMNNSHSTQHSGYTGCY